MRAFALTEIGDSEAIDVCLRREDAWAALAEILEDESDWAGSLFVVRLSSMGETCRRTSAGQD